MSDRKSSEPMLARPAEQTSTEVPVKDASARSGLMTDQRTQLDMESARALARRIRSKLEGRPQVEDSTEIVRKLRDA